MRQHLLTRPDLPMGRPTRQSTMRSMKTARIAALLMVGLLSACAPVTRLPVASGTVTVAAPKGYCIDRSASRDRAQGSFVLLGDCAAMTASGSASGPAAPVPVVLTALVSDPLQTAIPPDPDSLARFFRSDTGRAILSRSGRASSIRILQSEIRQGVLYLNLRDTSPEGDAALTDETWRAFLPLAGRMTVLSVRRLAEQPVSSDAALSVLRDFVGAVQAANPGPTAP